MCRIATEVRKRAPERRILLIGLFLLTGVFFMGPSLFANNLQITNGIIVDRDSVADTATIQFDISWDNSWSDSTNYDAVWVFMKYYTGSTWNHVTIFASGTNPSGFSTGSGTFIEILVPADKKGCFIQRSSSGTGTVDVESVQVVWDYAADGLSDSEIENASIKIFGIEMVFVPSGAFFAGDNETSTAAFDQGSGASETDPWYIDSEDAISVEDVTSNGYYYNSAGNSGENATGDEFIIPVSFPKGYQAFYVMKYEITQGQYADFLNTLTSSQASNRYPNQNGINRHTISGNYPDYSASRPDRACNYLSWMDLCAYADWAALRPMTELEFEKASRGEDIFPTDGELAWGNTVITAATAISGTEDGTETITNLEANCCYNNQIFTGGDGSTGPLRAGIFATVTSTRQQAGASFYGIMELSGNVWERCVTVGNSTGRSFSGTHGDGQLDSSGNANNSDWPGYTGGQVSGATGSGFRGGSWLETITGKMAVSDRSEAALTSTSRDSDTGGRCARTAP